MKGISKILTIGIALVFSLTLLTSLAFGQQAMKITKVEWEEQMAQWKNRETQAKADIEKYKKLADDACNEAERLAKEVTDLQARIYALLGTDENGIQRFINELMALKREIQSMLSLTPEELWQKKADVEALGEKVKEMKSNRIARLPRVAGHMREVEDLYYQLKNKMPKINYDEYSVAKGDYLWKISKKPEIYGDAHKWMKIYSFNTDQIKDPNLIYPDQVLKIHRRTTPNEYIVLRGESLYKIAGKSSVFGDPYKWNKLYETNKGFITDPNVIYPHSVLKITR